MLIDRMIIRGGRKLGLFAFFHQPKMYLYSVFAVSPANSAGVGGAILGF